MAATAYVKKIILVDSGDPPRHVALQLDLSDGRSLQWPIAGETLIVLRARLAEYEQIHADLKAWRPWLPD